jgi:deoxyribodipyrimidine photolyase-related protein
VTTRQATIIFPHQLFKNHPSLSKDREIFLFEEQLFFTGIDSSFRFHKQKLILHRASMKAYKKRLDSMGYHTHYIDFSPDSSMHNLFQQLNALNIRYIYLADPVDTALEKRLKEQSQKHNITVSITGTPNFLTPVEWLHDYFREARHFSMTHFYIAQRKRLNILTENGKPAGGKWSFDTENRKKFPKNQSLPPPLLCRQNSFVREAQEYVDNKFSDHPGSSDNFHYPVTHNEAAAWLKHFIKTRLMRFGDYEDAILKDEAMLFHAVLTPTLNIGLLSPEQIVNETLAFAASNAVPMNSLEGFLRQIIGWREFMRTVYALKGTAQRTTNYFQHKRRLPRSFYMGTTGIEPVDVVIKRIQQHAYAHHIERLMVLGNFMLLCEIDPDEVYRWFMEMFIDAYDWVMVPNVYGMSQYADGGLITTKPYISSSNYIRKMSDFSSGTWCEIWDDLYWRFICKHRNLFEQNPRMKVIANQLDRMPKARLKRHLTNADTFLDTL